MRLWSPDGVCVVIDGLPVLRCKQQEIFSGCMSPCFALKIFVVHPVVRFAHDVYSDVRVLRD